MTETTMTEITMTETKTCVGIPFSEKTVCQAGKESDGDKTLECWQNVHMVFFAKEDECRTFCLMKR